MGLRQTISEWVRIIKDALDFGPEFPAAMEARHVMFAQESARLQHLLEQTRKASEEKDELIARLRATGAVSGNMVVDGPAYYIKKANTLDGPFCTSCFQQNHEIMRITPAPKPKGADQTPADWVQCGRCKTPFRSDRISQYLNPSMGMGVQARTDATGCPSPDAVDRDCEPKPTLAQTAVCPEEDDTPKPVKTARKPRTRTRKPKAERPERTKATDRSEPTE
jgi:hypothetical protein